MDYARPRINMVDNQLRPSRIVEPRLLAAMAAVPRERFLPKALRGVAYADEDLLLPGGGHLIEPLALAQLIQAAAVGPEDVVLVLGCQSGYAGAVLARLAATVILVEPDQALVDRLELLLDQLGVDNAVAVVSADPSAGHPDQAPFDVILLAGAVPAVPASLLDQIDEGGRLVAVVDDGRVGRGTLFTRRHGVVGHRALFDGRVPRLSGWRDTPAFAF